MAVLDGKRRVSAALLGLQMTMIAKAVAAAVAVNPIVEVVSSQATGSTAASATLTDVRVGDQIFVLGIQTSGTPQTLVFSDAAGNSYTTQSLTVSQAAGYALVTASAVAASLKVNYAPGGGTSNRDIIVYHLRGVTASVDTANVIGAGSVSNPNGAVTNFAVTAAASALAITVMRVTTSSSSNPTVVIDQMPVGVNDFADNTSFNAYLVAHMRSVAGFSAQNVGFHCSVQSTANTVNKYVMVPLTWTGAVTNPPATPSILLDISQVPTVATVGVPYSGQVTASNTGGATGPITYDAVGLADGLTIDQATGLITGTATTVQTAAVTITATNGSQSASSDTTIQVSATGSGGGSTALAISMTTVSSGRSVHIKSLATGGSPGYTYTLDTGDGAVVTHNAKNVYSYAASGTYTVTCSVKDKLGNIASASKTITLTDYAPLSYPDVSGQSVNVTGTVNGDSVNVTLVPGQRLPMGSDKDGGSVVYHSDGMSVCVENAYMGTAGDLDCNLTITAGSSTIFSGALYIFARSRTRPFWLKQPALLASPDLTGMPNIDTTIGTTASMYSQYIAKDASPMSNGLIFPSLGATGFRPDLGPIPTWDACYLTNPSVQNAQVVRGMSDACAPVPFHAIDWATNKMVDMSQNPWISAMGTLLGTNAPSAFVGRGPSVNPFGQFTSLCAFDMDQAQAHAPQFNALASALYGTAYDKEELSLWTNYVNSLWQNPNYRLAHGSCTAVNSQDRGMARGLYLHLYASKYSADTAYFNTQILDTIQDYQQFLSQTGMHVVHFMPHPHNGIPPVNEHYLIYAIGRALEYGYTGFQSVFDWFCVTLFEQMIGTGVQHEFMCLYAASLIDANGNVAPDWKTCLQYTAVYDSNLAAALQCAESSIELQTAYLGANSGTQAGDFVRGIGADGAAAQSQPAYAIAVDKATDQTSAQAAWTKFKQYRRNDYSQNPKFNIIPRTLP